MPSHEQQKILDRLCKDYLDKENRRLTLVRTLAEAERDALIAEAKFKGVLEAFGGNEWQWDGQHVQLIQENGQTKGKAAKIPGESK